MAGFHIGMEFWWNRVHKSATVRCGTTLVSRFGVVPPHSKVAGKVLEADESRFASKLTCKFRIIESSSTEDFVHSGPRGDVHASRVLRCFEDYRKSASR